MIAVLSPLGTAQANGGGGIPVTPDSCDGAIDVLDTVHLNDVLSALGQADIEIDVDAHVALATNGVELDDLLAQVVVEAGAAGVDELLSGTVAIADVLHALAHVSAQDGELDVVAALQALELELGDVALDAIPLRELFSVSDLSLADGVAVDVLDVVINMVSLRDQHHAISAAAVTIDGDVLDLDASIVSATIDIDVGNPPRLVIGPEEVSAEMGNVELLVHADLADVEAILDATGLPFVGAKVLLGSIDLCVFAPWLSARADVLDDENGAAMLEARVGRIHMCVGKPAMGAIGEGADELDLETEVTPSVIGEVVVWIAGREVPIAKVLARAVVSAEASVSAVVFNGAFPACMPLKLGPTEAELWAKLFANLELTVEPLGIALTPLQITVLEEAVVGAVVGELSLGDALRTDLLDGIVLPSLDVLRSGLGSLDIKVLGADIAIDGGGNDGDANSDDGVDAEADVEIAVEEDVELGADTDVDVGVDVDMAGGASDANDGANEALRLGGGGCSASGARSASALGLGPLALVGLAVVFRARRTMTRR